MARILLKLAPALVAALSLLIAVGVAFGTTLDDTAVVITGRDTGSRSNTSMVMVASTARNLQITRRLPVASFMSDLSQDGRLIALIVQGRDTQAGYTTILETLTGSTLRLPDAFTFPPVINWAPKSHWATFIPGEITRDDLYVMNARLGTVISIVDGPVSDVVWSPDGQSLAFSRDAVIYATHYDGTDLRTLTDDTGFDSPAWSSDSRSLALRNQIQGAIYTVQADGTDLRNLTEGYAFESLSYPQWSPDGTHVAFSAVYQTRLVAYSVPVATGELIPIMDIPMFRDTRIIQVNWSPDSRSVGLLTATSAGDPHWYIVDRETGEVQFDVDGALPGPWSPDGTDFLYYVPDTTNPAFTTYETYLVEGDAAPRLLGNGDSALRWLPDGDGLLYTRSQVLTASPGVRAEQERRLYLLDLDGGGRFLTPPGFFVTDYAVLGD